ncbi:ATP-grasp domain-containing protein [Dyella tabacisoli]|uniref:ATP-grasp domain-containing protein n=1 Tax=Dyella tabacisoli TaxID=2282381 RepID=UPI00177A943F|nr:hypothetical protein [Dyella tabacisoli]
MSAYLAIATSSLCPGIHPDDTHFAASLERHGVHVTACLWNDPAVDWSRFDAVLVRTTWDYFKHYAAFLSWLDQLDRLGVPLINDSQLVRWNSEKGYLAELAQHGVAIIPTQIVNGDGLLDVLRTMQAQEIVIKPTVSGSAWHTVRGTVGEASFEQAVARLPTDFRYLLQPFVPEIISDGEWSLMYFAGEFSHAVIKRPAAGDYRVQNEYGGTAEAIMPGADILAAANQALAAVAAIGHADHAYVRVDGVVCAGRFLIMELELIEPFLHLAIRPEGAERFAEHIAARLTEKVASQAFAAPPLHVA